MQIYAYLLMHNIRYLFYKLIVTVISNVYVCLILLLIQYMCISQLSSEQFEAAQIHLNAIFKVKIAMLIEYNFIGKTPN